MVVKDLLFRYAQYNQWAHKRILDVIRGLTVEQQHATIPSSFNSLYKTVFHVWGAESLWLGRLNQEPITITGDPFNESMDNLSIALQAVDQLWVEWVKSKRDEH